MRIESIDPRFQSTPDRLIFDINYGNIKVGDDTKVDILVFDADHLSTEKSCGCTEPEIELQLDGSFRLRVIHDNKKTGTINQYLKEKVLDRQTKKEVEIRFNLKGTLTA